MNRLAGRVIADVGLQRRLTDSPNAIYMVIKADIYAALYRLDTL